MINKAWRLRSRKEQAILKNDEKKALGSHNQLGESLNGLYLGLYSSSLVLNGENQVDDLKEQMTIRRTIP